MHWLRAGLRRRVAVTFAVGALLQCALFSIAAYSITRGSLFDQRESAALRRVYQDARFLRDQLTTAGRSPGEALTDMAAPGATAVLVHQRGRWYSSALGVESAEIPQQLRRRSEPGPGGGQVAYMTATVRGQPQLVVGVPVAAVDAVIYEVSPLSELRAALRTLAIVLTAGTLTASALAALIGRQLAGQVLRPLHPLASTGVAIAAGDLSRRLPETRDPDLATIVHSFNSMVDALQQRIERDARFVADVSHELRSPLTTLVASVDLLHARRDQLPARSRPILDAVTAELNRFQALVTDLLELARSDAGTPIDTAPVELDALVRHTLLRGGRPTKLLTTSGPGPFVVTADKLRLERAVTNLLDNADRHGGGVAAVRVRREGSAVEVTVDDAGPGVPVEHRDRIFERFATAGGPRRNNRGTGLGLALVRETALAHRGTVAYQPRAAGGARFVLRLPAAP